VTCDQAPAAPGGCPARGAATPGRSPAAPVTAATPATPAASVEQEDGNYGLSGNFGPPWGTGCSAEAGISALRDAQAPQRPLAPGMRDPHRTAQRRADVDGHDTGTRTVMGTAEFVAPERIRVKKPDLPPTCSPRRHAFYALEGYSLFLRDGGSGGAGVRGRPLRPPLRSPRRAGQKSGRSPRVRPARRRRRPARHPGRPRQRILQQLKPAFRAQVMRLL
jgi:hypothetical protein